MSRAAPKNSVQTTPASSFEMLSYQVKDFRPLFPSPMAFGSPAASMSTG